MPLLRHDAVVVVVVAVELLRITASCSETEIRVCTAPKDNIYGFINFKTQQQQPTDRQTDNGNSRQQSVKPGQGDEVV